MHGANAPLMRTMVSQQMELEKKVLAGEVRLRTQALDNNLTNYGKLERTVIKLEDAVPLSEKESESQVNKKENDDNKEKLSNAVQDSKQVLYALLQVLNFLILIHCVLLLLQDQSNVEEDTTKEEDNAKTEEMDQANESTELENEKEEEVEPNIESESKQDPNNNVDIEE